MTPAPHIAQYPEPGRHLCMLQGDRLEIKLTIDPPCTGRAWLRTNIGHAAMTRAEIIAHVDDGAPLLGRAWFDIPMHRSASGQYSIVVGLSEVGHFQAKCFMLAENASEPNWPPGGNLVINVEPADTCCGNTLYNAFVRQFGPNKRGTDRLVSQHENAIEELENAGFAFIPPSGTFRNLISDLDFIVGTLGCRIIQLLPIHPTPTTYARMGRYGSPYAATSFIAVDPALAEFDTKATPLEQFLELVDAVHIRNASLFLDIAINHTGWAATLHATHPQWLLRSPDGEIEVPGAWGVTWADLTRLDYRHKALWRYMADVFLTWCRRGVDGFRCDAGYMIPSEVWQYIIARVRNQFPNTIFLLEGLGGKISDTRRLLGQANFNWAYSELFQNYEHSQIETYLTQAADISAKDGPLIHFAETHDNDRLAAKSHMYAQMRTSLCALLSFQGAFGFANGVEWFATQKINVHEAPSLNWGASKNQVAHIARLNRLLMVHPAFSHQGRLKWLPSHDGNLILLIRWHPGTGKKLLILINLDPENPVFAQWQYSDIDLPDESYDLMSGQKKLLGQSGSVAGIDLNPGETLCLSKDPGDLEPMDNDRLFFQVPQQVIDQRLRTNVIQVYNTFRQSADLNHVNLERETDRFRNNPKFFCRKLNRQSEESLVIAWQWPRDLHREVMVPPGWFLLIECDHPFRSTITHQENIISSESGLENSQRTYFALMKPTAIPTKHTRHNLNLTVYTPDGCQHNTTTVLYLAEPINEPVRTVFRPLNGASEDGLVLGTNGRGAMMRSHVNWGCLTSRYDALLAANLSTRYPGDRWMMLTRLRGWVVYQGYSQEIGPQTLVRFGFDYPATACWDHKLPTGQGKHVRIVLCLAMKADENLIFLTVFRRMQDGHPGRLADHMPVTLILRPDIEDRNFHDVTKAYTGPENHWRDSLKPSMSGFIFDPAPDHSLHVNLTESQFVLQPEWHYMVHRPLEVERGQDPESDLFSPGYFSSRMNGGNSRTLSAGAHGINDRAHDHAATPYHIDCERFFDTDETTIPIPAAMKRALDQYVSKRDDLHTVIAGYPWFLDWGRDTLIVCRGLITAGRLDVVRSIVRQFARFEKSGTIPNMIHGTDTGNRDTSDAPLWLYTVCADLARIGQDQSLFEMDCGGRTLRVVLISMARSLIKGTGNGIRLDSDSGLIFSPSHFTWMDTNHPAGTPRQGYPIEIQALWYAALVLLSRIDDKENGFRWRHLAKQVSQSIAALFYLPDRGYLSDCLHGSPGTIAEKAVPDNALRPNQLLAITLGALSDRDICKTILEACDRLLIPGAIRSLDDQVVSPPLKIVHNGRVLNKPETPYCGQYRGDEDTRRKPAYHNGTAWTWLFPSFCEAWYRVYGTASKRTVLAWLSSSTLLINTGCVGHVPEILDGDAPHKQRGCDAQAWGASELLRVWTLVDR